MVIELITTFSLDKDDKAIVDDTNNLGTKTRIQDVQSVGDKNKIIKLNVFLTPSISPCRFSAYKNAVQFVQFVS